MIAAVNRTLLTVIVVAIFVAAGAAFYFGARWFGRELRDKPYVASVKNELRELAAAQDSFQLRQGFYTSDIAQLPHYRVEDRYVHLRILDASTEGFLAEGNNEFWDGRCVIAVGPFAGDSLTAREPRCYWP
jgi:hypothetical protein